MSLCRILQYDRLLKATANGMACIRRLSQIPGSKENLFQFGTNGVKRGLLEVYVTGQNADLSIGSLAPDFRLSASNGSEIGLSDFRSNSSVYLFFVREFN
jgi:hypothetical protein